MRRSFAILIWILLGALAASLGIGSVLLHAKQERDDLAQKLQLEEAQTDRLAQEHQETIQEANRTVMAALRNASATRELLNAITQEQTSLEEAVPLVSSLQTKRWPQTISFPLGISIRAPLFTVTTSTDTLVESTVTTSDGQAGTWLFVTRYEAQRFQDLGNTLSDARIVNYRLNQTLIAGKRGTSSDGSTLFILRTQRRGQPIHLIWARIMGSMTEERILDSLSTLLFATNG